MSTFSKRYDESYESRNSGGARSGVLDWSKHDGKIEFYKIKEGTNKLNIIPYVIKTNNHPLVKRGVLKIGDLDYVLDIWVHKNVGPSDADVVCPKKTYGKPCPLCDMADEYNRAGKKEEFDAIKAKRRVFYNVEDVKAGEGKIYVLEQSHFKFEKEMIEEAHNGSDGEGTVDFADPSEGKVVKFRGSPNTFNGKTSLEPKNFQFVDRESSVSKAILKAAISFDELMVLRTTDEIMEIMNGSEDEDEDRDDDEKAPSPAPSDDDDTPPKRRASKDDDEDDEDEKAKPQIDKASEDTPQCPKGYVYGKDNDEKKGCADCPPATWKACARAAK